MKTCKKNIAIVLSLVLAAASIAMPSTESKAAKMKLNKSSVTVAVGKKVSLKVKGTTKKVSWTTSKKAIASVSKKGVVTGKNAGKATITAKVGTKKFRCKVTVKKSSKVKTLSNTQLAANCSFRVTKYKKGVLLSVKNNNSQTLDYVGANYILKTSNGTVIETGREGFNCLGVRDTFETSINLDEEKLADLDISKSVVKCTVVQNADGKHYQNMKKYLSESVSETDKVGTLNYSVKNTSSNYIEVYISIYYYDNAGNLVDVYWRWISLNPKQESLEEPLSAPNSYNNGEYVKEYATYKLITRAYA